MNCYQSVQKEKENVYLIVWRIIEWLLMEKTSKIISSNYPPTTNMPAKLCLLILYLLPGWNLLAKK